MKRWEKRKKRETERPGSAWEKGEKEKEANLGIGESKASHWEKHLEGCLLQLQAIDVFVQPEPTGKQKKGPHSVQLEDTMQVQGRSLRTPGSKPPQG